MLINIKKIVLFAIATASGVGGVHRYQYVRVQIMEHYNNYEGKPRVYSNEIGCMHIITWAQIENELNRICKKTGEQFEHYLLYRPNNHGPLNNGDSMAHFMLKLLRDDTRNDNLHRSELDSLPFLYHYLVTGNRH